MPTVSLGDADLYYEIHGEGPPVLLVAGLGGACGYWRPNVAAFAARYKTILHDHRGTGASTHALVDYSVAQMADDLVRLMDRLKIDRAHLVGHSTGGAIGQILGIEHPDRLHSLVLYASWTKADPFMRRVMAARRALVTTSGPTAYLNSTPVFLYPDWWINANEQVLVAREEQGLATFPNPQIAASRIDAILAFDRTADLHKIQVPTLVVCARDDFLTPLYFSEELAGAIPGARLAVLDRGGHACSEAASEEFNRTVFEFIDGSVATTGPR
jgi:aminoacrylate hydrolase